MRSAGGYIVAVLLMALFCAVNFFGVRWFVPLGWHGVFSAIATLNDHGVPWTNLILAFVVG